MALNTKRFSTQTQYALSTALIVGVAILCFLSVEILGYKVVALLLLLSVSAVAMLFDILPVLYAAVLSALIWNFFFIPPIFTFHITNAEDLLMFTMYFAIALLNAVMTFKIRAQETRARDKEEKEKTIILYDTLLNSLSHELRTPISTILGAIDTLTENKAKLSDSQQSELLSQIGIASTRLNRQVENLLNMSRLESGMLKLHYDWCDINELVFSVIHKFSLANQSHKLIYVSDENLPLFKLDAGLMEHVLHNILHNAIQYTPEKTEVRIVASNELDSCIICISDNGQGFPEKEIPFVFDKFFRLPNTKPGGSGLGLSISKSFVEAHNGKITLTNNFDGGAKFMIRIPTETSFIQNLKHE